MRAWSCALLVGLSLGCTSSSSGGGAPGGRGGQAGGAAGEAGGQAVGAAGQASGIGGQGGTGGSGGAVEIDAGSDGCTRLAQLSFLSIDERECGLAPPDSGAALCRWHINFTGATTFAWSHSDYVESGTYTCADNTITAQTQTRGTLTAVLDPAIWRFSWDGVVYVCTGCPP
jgi:hypothetical protein